MNLELTTGGDGAEHTIRGIAPLESYGMSTVGHTHTARKTRLSDVPAKPVVSSHSTDSRAVHS